MNFYSKVFKQNKNLPLDKFIKKALYDEDYGFYTRKNPFGLKGDFITSPNISVLFSEMIAIWCIAFWENLGKPKFINIVELGPGNGSLAFSLLKSFNNFNSFKDKYKIYLFEKSKYLIGLQKKKLISKNIHWISNLDKVKKGPIIIIANEFFDSLPIKQYFYKNKIWYERYVKLEKNNTLNFCSKKTSLPNFTKICKFDLSKNQKFIEFSPDTVKYIKKISKLLNKSGGGLICFDYGFKNGKMFNSLQAIKNHTFSTILSDPGYKDITHLINFDLLSVLFKKYNLQFEGITSQGEFLKKMGILERANLITKNYSFKKKADIYFRLKRLIHPNEMGELFKVMCFKKKGKKFNLGFS